MHRSTSASWCAGSRPAPCCAPPTSRAFRIPMNTETGGQVMQPDRFTIKSQEAIQAAQRLAHERAQPADHSRAPARRAARAGGGVVVPVLRKLGAALDAIRSELNAALDRLPEVRGAAASEARPSGELRPRLPGRGGRGPQALGRVHLDRAPAARARRLAGRVGGDPAASGATPEAILDALREVRGPHRVTDPNPEDKYQALERFGRDLTEPRRAGQARPRHRSRRRDPPRDPGALAPHQEQPRADRGARRRQDRDRRGTGAANRRRATFPSRCATAASSRSTSAR